MCASQIHNDDISQILILNKKSISNFETQLFQQELEKFRPHQQRLLQANHKQASLMKELNMSFNSLLQDKRVRSEQTKYESIQRQRGSVVNRYKRAYQEFLDLEAGLQGAKRWYSEMKETVDSLEKNVETFVNNRRSEGATLLSQIEQEQAANKSSQAELERERLRGLMDRMAIDPNANAPTKPALNRPTPAPLNFASPGQPSYPQTSFGGQYQLPGSPPPNQSSYPSFSSPPPQTTYSQAPQQPYTPSAMQTSFGQQAAYNPSSWGRNPGPTSPPPNQASFALGPASPPPTQISFSQHQYSTYGNHQQPQPQQPQHMQPQQPQQVPQQQQSYGVPSNFVPPPPPPGPPPLGPQQTFHYDQHEQQQQNPYGQPQQPQSGAYGRHSQPPQQQQDPWAGLSAWR